MKRKIVLLLVLIIIECLILGIYYPKKQQEIVQLAIEIQEVIEQSKKLDYQTTHIENLEAQIEEQNIKIDKKDAREQLLDLLKKIETYPFQEIQYKKVKDYMPLKNRYLFSTIGHYDNVIDLLEYIDEQMNAIEIMSLYLDSSVQNVNDPTNLIYITTYGDKLEDIYAINLEWIVDNN